MYEDLISPRNRDWLRSSELNPFVDAYTNYLGQYGYSDQSIRTYSRIG